MSGMSSDAPSCVIMTHRAELRGHKNKTSESVNSRHARPSDMHGRMDWPRGRDTMSDKSYVIRNAGQYESTLGACGSPIRTTEYRSVREAARDVARVACLDADALSIVGPCGEADWYVYPDAEARDDDADGSRALAIIVTSESYEREAATGLFSDE
jgi:hypothetical protein